MVHKMFKRAKRAEPMPFQTSRTGMVFLLAGLVVVLLSHIDHLPLWTSLTCFSLIMWRLLYDMHRLPLPNRYVLFLMFALIILGVLSHYLTIVGREAGTALLITLICLKLFEIKSLRDISLIIQLAFFAIVVTFLFSQSIFVALSMLVAVVLLITALISFQHAKSGKYRLAYSDKDHLRLATKMVMYAIPLAIIIFIFFPRTSTPLWGLPHDAFAAKTGLSDEMSPGNISNLVDSQEVAFRVQFQSRIPEPAKTYWRGPVLWAFDGHTWSAPVLQRRAMKTIPLVNPANPIEYTITLEPHNNFWLFALDQPGTIPDHALLSTEMQLLARKPVNHLTRYEMTSYLQYSLPWIGWLAPERYLQIPTEAAPRARQYMQALKQQYPDKAGLVNAVLQRFRNQQYLYTRQPPRLFGDPTDAFLFDTKRGYCEHYASSFTVLMRLAGIPARVVTGYQGGEMNPLSNYMIVRQSDAHAWSEIYLKDKGWLRVDPTAVIPAGNIENASDLDRFRSDLFDAGNPSEQNWFTASAKQLQYAWDLVNNRWNQWVIGYSNQKQKSLFKAIGIPEITWRGLIYVLFAMLSVFTLLIAANIFQAQRTRKNAIDKIYQQFLRKLRPLHIEKSPSEGALNFSQRVARRFPNQTAELIHIAKLYNQIRYTDANPDVVDALRHAVRSMRLKNER
jgi:transglutaminase-like putative cysteine protease